MIYSLDHKFLLLKNAKVGGSSLEVELSKILPDNAIVTPIDPKNLEHNPRNYEIKFYNHAPYSLIKNFLDLNDVKKYVFVRNPYSVVLSDFFHILHDRVSPNFKKYNDKDFLNKELDMYFSNNMIKNTHWIYTENNKIIVDKILYYENGIEDEINKVLPSHGIDNIKMQTFEKKYKPDWANYKDIFNDEHIDKINKEWSWEFKNLGYSLL